MAPPQPPTRPGYGAEPPDRVDCPGREFRVVAVKGDVDLDRRFGAAGEWIGKVHDRCELLGGGAEVVRVVTTMGDISASARHGR